MYLTFDPNIKVNFKSISISHNLLYHKYRSSRIDKLFDPKQMKMGRFTSLYIDKVLV